MTNNMTCPFCGERVAGIGKNFYNQYVVITCTNPKCNASTHFKTTNIKEAMDQFSKRAIQEQEELALYKKCPFCGKEANIYSDGKVYVVGCNTPECRGNYNDTSGGWTNPAKAIVLWNARGKHPELQEEEDEDSRSKEDNGNL